MRIDLQFFQEALDKQDGLKANFLPFPPKRYKLWIEYLKIPSELKKFLEYLSLSEEFGLGAATLLTPEQIIKEYEDFPSIFKAGFLIIGSAGNGDMLAIDFKKGEGNTGYLSHEDLWGSEYKDPHDYFLNIAESVGKFALKAIDYKNCPMDYFGTMPDDDDEE